MSTDPGDIAFARDLFAGLGPITTRRIFGGTGLYIDDAMFAVLFDETLYMKADAALIPAYLAAGSVPFSYASKTGTRTIPGLTSLPEGALDDTDEALDWARQSLVAAQAAAVERHARAARKRG